MKKIKTILSIMLVAVLGGFFTSCSKDTPSKPVIPKNITSAIPGKYMGELLVGTNKLGTKEITFTTNQVTLSLANEEFLSRIITDKTLLDEAKKSVKAPSFTASWMPTNFQEGKTAGTGTLLMTLTPAKQYTLSYKQKGKDVMAMVAFTPATAIYNADSKKLNMNITVSNITIDKKKVNSFKAFTFKVMDATKAQK